MRILNMAATSFAASLLGVLAAGPAAAGETFHDRAERRIAEIVDAALAQHRIPGAVVGVRIGGVGTWLTARGKADLAAGRDAEPTDPSRIGSTTKAFAAAAVLRLADRGHLGLDAKLGDFAAGEGVPNASAITVRQLLNHTSGLFDYWNDEKFMAEVFVNPDRTWTEKELVAIASAHGPQSAPGEKWDYSNTNYVLLGMIAEETARAPIADQIRDAAVVPLALSGTVFPTGPGIEGDYLHGYWDEECNGLLTDCSPYQPTAEYGAGAMISTAADLLVFGKAFAEGALFEKESTRREMRTLTDARGRVKYGLGCEYTGGFYGHGGNIRGYDTSMFHCPSLDASFVVMLNRQIGYDGCAPMVGVSQQIFKQIAGEFISLSSLLQLDLNGREAAVGDTVSVLGVAAHITAPFDAYCVVEDPRGGRFSLMEGGALLPGVVLFARGVAFVSDAAVVRLFQAPLPGGMLPGRYTVTLAITDPGAKPSLAAARAWRQDRLDLK